MRWVLRIGILLLAFGSLLLLGRLAGDWVGMARLTGEPPRPVPPRSFDWVQWEDLDGEIVAAYVYPGGTAYAEGLRPGAVLYRLEGQHFFSAEDVKRVVEGMRPGREVLYEVMERTPAGPQPVGYVIPLTRYPTFLYPLGAALWQASIWGFALVTFAHVLALVTVLPLARRTRRARRTAALVAAATVWVGGMLARLLLLTVFGPPTGGLYALLFEALTYVALGSWILFPALLVYAVLSEAPALRRDPAWRALVFVPAIVLGGVVVALALGLRLGPLTLDTLIAPVLFYVCCYVAAAAGLTLLGGRVLGRGRGEGHVVPAPTAWSRAGSAVVLAAAALGALTVEGVIPLLGTISDATVGWLILSLQLLSLLPVGVVSLATLRHGRVDAVVTSALAHTAGLGSAFVVAFGGLLAIQRLLAGAESTTIAAASGLFVVAVLVLAERGARLARRLAPRWALTERQRARERLREAGERIRYLLDAGELADAVIRAVGEALDARSAVLFLRDPRVEQERWLRAAYRPEPPYFTEADLARVWARLQATGAVWGANPELDEARLPPEDDRLLRGLGVALAVPVVGSESAPAGLLVLGRKLRRRAVYNLEDVALLRGLAGQLALAVERLRLIEREKALVREAAQAQLTALRAQINPHFLFNTLNTIAALIATAPEEAERAVERLAQIFRHTLHTEDRAFVPLRDELRLVRDYLALEQARFGEGLRVEETWDPRLMDLPLPAFALQTLVENAVQHGIERQRGGGRVGLSGHLDEREGMAVLRVMDTGPGLPIPSEGDGAATPGSFFGKGLSNVAGRLSRLYGRDDLLRFESRPGQGTTAELRIPLEPERVPA